MVSAVVLAAGTSTRMGSINKLLLAYQNETVIVHVVKNILGGGIEEVIVVTGNEAPLIQHVLKDLPVCFVYNPRYANGITTSIQCGVQQASGQGYMICLSDMVLITSEEYALLRHSFEQQIKLNPACIGLPRYKNRKGNPVIFSSWYKEAILQHKNQEGCKEIVQLNKENIYWIDMPSDHVLQDMDYPEDYERIAFPSE